MNPQVKEDRFKGFVFQADPAARQRVIGTSFKEQLDLGLSCGKCFKRVRVCSVQSAADLLCPLCTDEQLLITHGKTVPGVNEKRIAALLQHCGLLAAFRFQPKVVQGWQGGVDFFCPAANLILQIDDPHHFRTHSIHHSSRGEVLANDMKFNQLCWQQGFALLRLSQPDAEHPALSRDLIMSVLSHMQQNPCSKLLVLSAFYGNVRLGELDCTGTGHGMYVAACEAELAVVVKQQPRVHDSYWFAPTL